MDQVKIPFGVYTFDVVVFVIKHCELVTLQPQRNAHDFLVRMESEQDLIISWAGFRLMAKRVRRWHFEEILNLLDLGSRQKNRRVNTIAI